MQTWKPGPAASCSLPTASRLASRTGQTPTPAFHESSRLLDATASPVRLPCLNVWVMQPEAFGRSPLQARRTWPGRALKLSTGAFLGVRGTCPVPEEGLVGLERLAARTAETGRRLRKVEQVREHVQREMSGAQVQQKLSRHHLLIWRPALGEPLYRRLDAPQAPDVGER